MKTLSQILDAASQVRAEQQESENTAERVGGVLCDLTDFLQNKTALTGINVRTNANGVTIEVRAQTGDGQESSTSLVFPKATETQAGIITAELLQTLRAGINSNSDTIQNLNTVLQDCVSKISAAQASIHENSNNIKNILAADQLRDTRLANHGTAIENNQALLRKHRTDIADAKAAISAAQESIQENADDIAAAKTSISAAKADIQYQSSRIDTLHRASDKQDLSIEKNHNDIKEVQSKLDEYPSQFILDLGTVSSQKEGEYRAASSEVAGNRNISFIRFQTQGVNNLKTILILQYPNGVNETAQIMFVDKAQWRRNVTGATGVKGAATTATQFERTAPHYLGYDAANRKIQFKDYTQTVSRDVELPLVSASSAGLMSAEDKAALESAKKDVPELRYRMQGREDKSENCSAYTYPFISLGDFSGWDVFSSKLKNGDLMGQKYMGRCRARVNGVTVEMYQFINSFSQNNYTQVILGNVSADENGDVKFTPDNFNIIHRQYKDGVWTAWQRINSHPLATPSSDGFMSSQDKDKLENYPSQFVLDLGTMPTESEGDARAASSEVAGNRNISFIRFQTQGVSNLKTTLILQWPNGVNYTAQIKFVDKAQWRRNVTGATGVKGASTTATQWERTAPHYLGYDAANRKIQFKDYTQTVSREVQLPLVSASSAGLLSPDMLSIFEEMLEKISGYAEEFRDNPVADSGNISGTPRNGLMPASALAKLENYPTFPQDLQEVTEQQNGLMTSADKVKLDAYPSDPLKIPLATASKAGLLSDADFQKIQWLISERDRISNAINDIDTRLRALENK